MRAATGKVVRGQESNCSRGWLAWNCSDTSLLERESRWWDDALRFKQHLGTHELPATCSGGSKYLWLQGGSVGGKTPTLAHTTDFDKKRLK